MNIKIERPSHVPLELYPVWKAAAKKVASAGKVLTKVRTASGEKQVVNYGLINSTYKRILAKYIDIAEQAGSK